MLSEGFYCRLRGPPGPSKLQELLHLEAWDVLAPRPNEEQRLARGIAVSR